MNAAANRPRPGGEVLLPHRRGHLARDGNGSTERERHLFGLADLGRWAPYVDPNWAASPRLSELENFRGPKPWELGIERDLYFKPRYPLSVYAEAARAAQRIVETGPIGPARGRRPRSPPTGPTRERRLRCRCRRIRRRPDGRPRRCRAQDSGASARDNAPRPRDRVVSGASPIVRTICPMGFDGTAPPCSSSTPGACNPSGVATDAAPTPAGR